MSKILIVVCDKCGNTEKRASKLPPLVCPGCGAWCCEKCMPAGVRTLCVDCEDLAP